MKFVDLIMDLQNALNALGEKLTVDGEFGPKTKAALEKFSVSLKLLKKDLPISEGVLPQYPSEHPFHPRFKVPSPFTHLHPIDVLRSVAGEKEISGSKDNPLIAHFHEHAGNLGTHSDKNDYSDEVPHCSSALNWAADMSGCAKTNNALARSWKNYGKSRLGDLVMEGDIITLKDSHVTLANTEFNLLRTRFEGFGSNQGNTIKTSTYKTSDISSIRIWQPLPGTVLAPPGILGAKPVPSTGTVGESTT